MSTFTTVQFTIPKSVGQALDSKAIADAARAAGLERTRFEYSEVKTSPLKGRVTCQRELAPFIIEAIAQISGRSTGQLVFDCAAAALAAQQALAGEVVRG